MESLACHSEVYVILLDDDDDDVADVNELLLDCICHHSVMYGTLRF